MGYRIRRVGSIGVPIVAGLLAARALAQASAPEPGAGPQPQLAEAPQVEDEVIVRGRRMSEIKSELRIYVQKFVEQVARAPTGRGYARWHDRVCVGVHNLRTDAAQYIVDRISQLAAEVGLEPGEPGCAPDVVVIFTTDGQSTATAIAENYPSWLRPTGEGGQHLGLGALKDFEKSDKAVRWWHLSIPVDARHGTPAIRVRENGSNPPPAIAVAGPSRIHSGIRDDLRLALVIVDGRKLRGTTWQELGDYLALVSLAQIDPRTDPAPFDTILNLFSNPAAYSGLTDWDRSYLHALYDYDQERMPRLQVNALVGQIVDRAVDSAQ